MKPETEKLLKETKYMLFESDEFKPVRDFICKTPPDTDHALEDLDTIFERIDRNAPAMRNWVDTLLGVNADVQIPMEPVSPNQPTFFDYCSQFFFE
jgi:hypothetical protein